MDKVGRYKWQFLAYAKIHLCEISKFHVSFPLYSFIIVICISLLHGTKVEKCWMQLKKMSYEGTFLVIKACSFHWLNFMLAEFRNVLLVIS